MRLLVPNLPLLNTLPRLVFIYMVDVDNRQSTIFQSSCQISLEKIRYNLFAVPTNFSRIYSSGTLQLSVHTGESALLASRPQPQVSASSSWNHSVDEETQVNHSVDEKTQVNCSSDNLDNLCVECKETERRRKISLANKGKAPWNKGRKHSAETRALIKQRTIEALRDPKVRKKMSDGHHAHSEETKAKIGLGQRRVWRKRNRLKNIKEKFYQIWAGNIAVAAKSGWRDQEELEWDSYEKLMAKMAKNQLQLVADKEKAKEMAILAATRQKAEKMARRAQPKKERAKSEEVRKRARRKAAEEKDHPISKGFKLKTRMTKIRQKKYMEGHVIITGDFTLSDQPAIEKLDLEFIKREKLRRESSLADQIQAAKMRRVESTRKEVPTKISSSFIMNDRVEQLVSIVYVNKP